jgi:hypothetical protein
VQLALDGIKARAASLATPEDPGFNVQIRQLLSDLRRLQPTTANAARTVTGPGGTCCFPSCAAPTPSSCCTRARCSVGARLYAARRGTELTVEEAAAAAGVDSQAVADAEADRPVPADAAKAIEALIAQLGHR